MNYRIGLDLGITSIGWAVLRNDNNGEAIGIEDLGIRIFDVAQNSQDGTSLCLPRRVARGARRRLRRQRFRKERIKQLFERENIISKSDIEKIFTGNKLEDIYKIRFEGLERKLEIEEWVRLLLHYAQRRGYKSNSKFEEADEKSDSGKALAAIKENACILSEKKYRTIGEMLFKDEKFQLIVGGKTVCIKDTPIRKVRNCSDDYKFTMPRSLVCEEIKKVFEIQYNLGNDNANDLFYNEYIEIFNSQRDYAKGPGGNSKYGGDLIAKMLGECTFIEGEPRAVKASYSFEYFRLLQNINHIRIGENKKETVALDKVQREAIINAAHKNSKLEYGKIRKLAGMKEKQYFTNISYRGDDSEKKNYILGLPAYVTMSKGLEKVAKNAINYINHEKLDKIAYILTVFKSDAQRIEELKKLEIEEIYFSAFCKMNFSETGNLSIKAIKEISPYLEQGQVYSEATINAGYDFRNRNASDKKEKLSIRGIGDITNPIVRRVISQTFKVLNAITRKYGEPQLVCIELARDLSKDFKERKDIENTQKENRAKNEAIVEQIKSYGKIKPTGEDIVKFKLWREQKETCLYSGQHLDIDKLFDDGYCDVDHIIPYSISYDDSYLNKVLVKSEENRMKGNRLPMQYLSNNSQRVYEFETLVNTLVWNKTKRSKLLTEKITDDDINKFKERNLNDTKYATRLIYGYLNSTMKFADSPFRLKPVLPVNGAITAYLRKRYGLTKVREDGDLHHAMDAVVIAVTSQSMINKITKYSKNMENRYDKNNAFFDYEQDKELSLTEFKEKYGFSLPMPWDNFRNEVLARLSVDPVTQLYAIGKSTVNSLNADEIKPIFVSHMPRHKSSGQAHKETMYRNERIENVKTNTLENCIIYKKDLKKLKLDKDGEIANYYNKTSDILLYNALVKRLKEFENNGEKAFGTPFFKPKSDQSDGPLVKKVKLYKKASLVVEAREGGATAQNGDMVRIDMFKVEGDGYYFVPIYVSDLIKKTLPNKAVVGNKPYEEWKEMSDNNFIFSIYPEDLLYIEHKNDFILTSNNKENKMTWTVSNGYFYYIKANISTGVIGIENHDRSFSIGSFGIKTLKSIRKCEIDLLGNHKIIENNETRQYYNLKKGKKNGI